MRDHTIIQALTERDVAVKKIEENIKALAKNGDRVYLRSLTHEMMWDVLMGFLIEKGLFTKAQFDEALKELAAKTQAAMDAEAKAKAEAKELAAGKVTILSDKPEITVH